MKPPPSLFPCFFPSLCLQLKYCEHFLSLSQKPSWFSCWKYYISRNSFLRPQQTKMFGHHTLEINIYFLFSSVTQLCLTLRFHGLQHTRFPCPSPVPRACSNSCPSSPWCHQTISSYVVPFSSWLQSCPASGPFPMSQFLTSGGHTTGVSASAAVLPVNIQDWFPLWLTGWISLQSKGLSRVIQCHSYSSLYILT